MAESNDAEQADTPLYKELRKLRERGLRYGTSLREPYPELMTIADAICPDVRGDVDRLKCAMSKAVRRLGGGDYSKALEVLWGLDDDAFGKSLPLRIDKALPLLDVASPGAYERSHRKPTAEAFEAQLRALHAEAVSARQAEASPFRFAVSRLLQRRNLIIISAAVLLLAACYFVASLTIWGGGNVVPPMGTIVNATTGQVVQTVVNRTTPRFVQVTGEISACDLTTAPTCGYVREGARLRVHIGDIVEFSTQLFDPSNQPVPYLYMYTENTTGERVNGRLVSYDGLRMNVHWPTRYGDLREEPKSSEPVEIVYPKATGATNLTYIPGSTVLFDQKGRVLAHLPDGIMEAGIALTDVGAPPSCSYCETEYTRYVNFKVTVTSYGHT